MRCSDSASSWCACHDRSASTGSEQLAQLAGFVLSQLSKGNFRCFGPNTWILMVSVC